MTGSDASLVERALAGDSSAYATLMRRHFEAAFTLARLLTATKEDAEDACQDAFARAWFRLESCRQPAQFRAWLMQIVRRRSHSLRAYQALRACVALDQVAEPAGLGSPLGDLELDELHRALRKALAELPSIQRAVVRHSAIDGWTHRQVAQQLGLSELMSRRHLSDARKKIKAAVLAFTLEEDDDE